MCKNHREEDDPGLPPRALLCSGAARRRARCGQWPVTLTLLWPQTYWTCTNARGRTGQTAPLPRPAIHFRNADARRVDGVPQQETLRGGSALQAYTCRSTCSMCITTAQGSPRGHTGATRGWEGRVQGGRRRAQSLEVTWAHEEGQREGEGTRPARVSGEAPARGVDAPERGGAPSAQCGVAQWAGAAAGLRRGVGGKTVVVHEGAVGGVAG
jgi:hypothetical protein